MNNKTIIFVFIFIIINLSKNQCTQDNSYRNIIDKKTPNFTQIAAQIGFGVNEYDVITQDSYILKLFHIPGDKSRPVLLMHGIIDSSDTFIIRGNASLAVVLARAGYDVWLGNTRGNRYARRHIYLDPDGDEEFWDFSFEEYGFYDLPAIIDFVLARTGEKNLSAVGHSQGNTIFLVLGATRPEYNDKIKIMVALSPICFLSNLKNTALFLMHSIPIIDTFLTLVGEEELMGDDTAAGRLFKAVCGCKKNYKICAYGLFFPIAGSDPMEMESEFFATVIAHYPTGTSKKNAIHLAQVGTNKRFSKFDYNWRNMDIYNSTVPPDYELSKVSMKVALVAGRNDQLSTLEDVELLRIRLPNVVEYIIIEHKKFNHIDAVWGRNMARYLFPHVLQVLVKYS